MGGPASYYLQINTGRYDLGWTPQGGIGITGINKGETFYGNYETVGYGHLIFHFKNVNCQGPNDTLQFYFDGSDIGADDFLIGKFGEEYGCIDGSTPELKYPMGNRHYHWTVTRGGVSTTTYATIYVEEDQTTTFEIFY